MNNLLYNEVGNYYDTDAADYDNRYWKNPVVQQIRQSFREEVKRYPFNTLLEVGCGTGIDLVHFGLTHPGAEISGIDISTGMIAIARNKINQNQLTNVQVFNASVEECAELFGNHRFDMIYVFFGALNTVENLAFNAGILRNLLVPGGKLVVTFVNKWYLGGIFLDALRFRFRRAVSRLRRVWGGYAEARSMTSRCYSPSGIRKAFKGYRIVSHHGYSIVHPAWYFTGINRKLGRFRKVLWKIDEWLNHTPFWRFGEYTLFTFQNGNSLD